MTGIGITLKRLLEEGRIAQEEMDNAVLKD